MLECGFKRLEANNYVYIRRFDQEKHIILFLCGDAMVIVVHDKNMINRLKNDFGSQFAMKDLGPTQVILGMRIMCDKKKKILWLSQEKYIEKVLNRFNMKDAKPTSHLRFGVCLGPLRTRRKKK